MEVSNIWYVFLLVLLVPMAWLIFSFKKWKLKAREAFAEKKFQRNIFKTEGRFSSLFPFLYVLGLLFLILAIIDFVGGKKEMKIGQHTNSVIFLLDVSNSMNAQDVEPNRLEMAKALIINSVQKVKDGRVGIIVFAGEAESIMPLTTDYEAVETYLSSVDTNIIGRQGTDFFSALQKAGKKFKNIPEGYRKVILISDGEDNEGNDKAAIDEAKRQGIVINCVAIGSEEGAPIPDYEFGQLMGYRTDVNGQTVITKRQTQALMEMASETKGKFIDGNNLEQGILNISKILTEKGNEETTVNAQFSEHYYQWFLAVSLLLFSIIYLFNPKKDLNL